MKTITTLIILLLPLLIYGQDSAYSPKSNTWKIGVRLAQHHNFSLAHSTLGLTFRTKNHSFHVGPEYTRLFEPMGDPVDPYERKYWGVNLGYRYTFDSKWEKLLSFVQTDFSIYQYKFTEVQLGPPFQTKHRELTFENTVALGFAYRIFENFEVSAGFGFGSTERFFLKIEEFMLHSFVGVEHKF